MSVLTGSKTSANIIANESTEIYLADLLFMSRLFKTEPGIYRRFYRDAALKLAKKLREVGTTKTDENNTDPTRVHVVDSRDKRFIQLFDLPKDELVIQGKKIFLFPLEVKQKKHFFSVI